MSMFQDFLCFMFCSFAGGSGVIVEWFLDGSWMLPIANFLV